MTLMSTNFISVESYSERQERNVQRVLDSLERSESRLVDHYAKMRGHQRTTCRKVISIRIPNPGEAPFEFSVYMRDISSKGASFIYPGDIATSEIMVGIPIPGRDHTWFLGEIVRRKEYSDEQMWEFGVKFKDRLI